ncbi:MAG: ABC transporter permease, partial [Acetobacteraceae bacterium]
MGGIGLERTRLLLLVGFLAVALGGFALVDVRILAPGNLTSMAVFGVEIGILALGQTFVICGGDGGVDLSVGAIAALSQVLLGLVLRHHLPWPFAVGVALIAGAAMGLANGLLYAVLRIPSIIVTLATMFAFYGLALVLTGGINIDLTASSPAFLAIGQGSVIGLPFQVLLIYLPVFLVVAYVQLFTAFGRGLYLTGTNDLAARLAGIGVDRIRCFTFVIAGVLAGLAGTVSAARLGTARPDASETGNLLSIAIVVLGGADIFGGDGSVIGSALATMVIAVVDYGLSYNNFNPIYQAGVIGVILIGAVVAQNLVRLRARRA